MKTRQVNLDHLSGHFRGHFRGCLRGTFRGSFRGESLKPENRENQLLSPVLRTRRPPTVPQCSIILKVTKDRPKSANILFLSLVAYFSLVDISAPKKKILSPPPPQKFPNSPQTLPASRPPSWRPPPPGILNKKNHCPPPLLAPWTPLPLPRAEKKKNPKHPPSLAILGSAAFSCPVEPAKSKRGREEGDGIENVINCRDVWGTGGILFREYCFGEENSLSSAANSVSSARNSVSSPLHTNNKPKGTH